MKWPQSVLVVLACASVTGCAPPGTYRKVRGEIREVVAAQLGPADRYDISTSRDSPKKLLDGRIARVDIHGVNVRPAPGYVFDDIFVTARNVRFNRKAKTVQGSDETTVTAYISEPSLSAMLTQLDVLKEATARITPEGVEVSGNISPVGAVPVTVTAFGQLSVSGPSSVTFTSQRVTAGGLPFPLPISRALDLSTLYEPLVLHGIGLESGRVVMKGTIDWSKIR